MNGQVTQKSNFYSKLFFKQHDGNKALRHDSKCCTSSHVTELKSADSEEMSTQYSASLDLKVTGNNGTPSSCKNCETSSSPKDSGTPKRRSFIKTIKNSLSSDSLPKYSNTIKEATLNFARKSFVRIRSSGTLSSAVSKENSHSVNSSPLTSSASSVIHSNSDYSDSEFIFKSNILSPFSSPNFLECNNSINWRAISSKYLPDYTSKIKAIFDPFATVFDVIDDPSLLLQTSYYQIESSCNSSDTIGFENTTLEVYDDSNTINMKHLLSLQPSNTVVNNALEDLESTNLDSHLKGSSISSSDPDIYLTNQTVEQQRNGSNQISLSSIETAISSNNFELIKSLYQENKEASVTSELVDCALKSKNLEILKFLLSHTEDKMLLKCNLHIIFNSLSNLKDYKEKIFFITDFLEWSISHLIQIEGSYDALDLCFDSIPDFDHVNSDIITKLILTMAFTFSQHFSLDATKHIICKSRFFNSLNQSNKEKVMGEIKMSYNDSSDNTAFRKGILHIWSNNPAHQTQRGQLNLNTFKNTDKTQQNPLDLNTSENHNCYDMQSKPSSIVKKNVHFPDHDTYTLNMEIDNELNITFTSLHLHEPPDNPTKVTNSQAKKVNLFVDGCLFSSLIRDQDAIQLFPLTDSELFEFTDLMVSPHEFMFSLIQTSLSKQFSEMLFHQNEIKGTQFVKNIPLMNYFSTHGKNSLTKSKSNSAADSNHSSLIESQCYFQNTEDITYSQYTNNINTFTLMASLTGQREPQISLSAYLSRIIQYGNIGCHEIIIAFILISRALYSHPALGLSPLNAHRLLLSACIITSKIYKDAFYANSIWSTVGGITTKEMNQLEANFLQLLNYRTHVILDQYAACYCLVKQSISNGTSRLHEMRTQLYFEDEIPDLITNQPFANLLFFQPHLHLKKIESKSNKD